MSGPALVAVAHGSRDPLAQRTVEELVRQVRRRLVGVEVAVAYVQNALPLLGTVLGRLGQEAVAVPLLLSRGFHVGEDIGREAREVGALVADPLGPDLRLCDALLDRLVEAGAPSGAPIVLAAAGSSDPLALADVERQADLLAQRAGVPVHAAYASAARPSVEEAVTELRAQTGREPVVASYLLAPGVFQDRLRSAAPVVSAPLGSHHVVVDLVVRRYRHAAKGCLV